MNDNENGLPQMPSRFNPSSLRNAMEREHDRIAQIRYAVIITVMATVLFTVVAAIILIVWG